jgi:type IV pilus assembly protein PilY1
MARQSKGRFFGALAAAGTLSLTASSAMAQSDVRLIRPNVLLLMDTSGSMEWRNGIANDQCFGGDGGSCNQCDLGGGRFVSLCSPSCPASQAKNRWTTAVEVLTGDVDTFSCREVARTNAAQFPYDFNYTIPHHEILSRGVPLSDPTAFQQANGLLDTYAERLRFGFMSFDNDYCHGLTADYGQYSYGPDRQYRAAGCMSPPVTMNLGARRPTSDALADPVPGGLISVGPANLDSAGMAQVNTRIQQTITGTRDMLGRVVPGMRPFGGTPTAALLEDAYYYWTTHDDVRPRGAGGAGGDPYFSCRPRYNVLVTDGRPNMDFGVSDPGGPVCDIANGLCPYQPPSTTAMQMAAPGAGQPNVKTWVVAFNAMDLATVTSLNAIATAGGGRLLTANDAATLRTALDAAFSTFSQGTTTRTSPSFGSSSASAMVGANYQFNTSFAIVPGAPWEGVLERRRSVCEGAPPAPVDKPFDMATDDFGALLKFSNRNAAGRGWGARQVWTYAPPAVASVAQLTGSLSAAALGSARNALDATMAPWVVGAVNPAQRDNIFAWLRGDVGTIRENRPLGDIFHSNPVIVGAPLVSLPDQSYAQFKSRVLLPTGTRRTQVTVGTREGTLYVGTNDGILHAFHVDTGEELWAFVPPALLPSMAQRVPSTRMSGVDGSPVSRDVIYTRTLGTAATGNDWHTLLVTGLRDGGGAYVAMDVSDPYRPQFLWQFTDTDMQYGYGTPMIATIRTTWRTGSLHERAVVLIPGGAGSQAAVCNAALNPRPAAGRSQVRFVGADGRPRLSTRCWTGTAGQFIYVVDAQTGDLIRKIGTGPGGLLPTRSPIIGSVSGYLAGEAAVTNRAYVGDADGDLWRLDLGQANPAGWSFDLAYDTFWDAAYNEGQPIVNAPVITVDRNGDTLIAVGTGDPDLLEGFDLNRVLMIRERDPLPADPTNPVDVSAHWVLRQNADPMRGFSPGERLTGPMSLFNGVLYFGTFVPANNADACQLGYSRLWGVDETQIDPLTSAGPTGLPLARLDVDGDATTTMDIVRVTRDLAGNGTLDDDENSVLFGVGISRRVSCPQVGTTSDPFFGGNRQYVSGIQGGDYRLVIQTGRGGVLPGGAMAQRTNVVSRVLPPPQLEQRLESWATVFE